MFHFSPLLNVSHPIWGPTAALICAESKAALSQLISITATGLEDECKLDGIKECAGIVRATEWNRVEHEMLCNKI